MGTVKAIILHEEHSEWLKKLDFYKDDLAVLQKKLEDLIRRSSRKSVLEMVEQFQNRMKIQRNEIDELKHSINDHGIYVDNKIDSNPQAVNTILLDHAKERDRVQQFEKLYAEMRREFIGFLAKT